MFSTFALITYSIFFYKEDSLFYLYFKLICFWLCWVFVAALQAFSSYDELLFLSTGSRVRTQQLLHISLIVLRHEGSSWTRKLIHVPRIGRRILNYWTTREVPFSFFYTLLRFYFFFKSQPVFFLIIVSPCLVEYIFSLTILLGCRSLQTFSP